MDEEREMFWIDLMRGMEGRAACIFSDTEGNNRNDSWYAREVYGDKYYRIRTTYQKRKMNDLYE